MIPTSAQHARGILAVGALLWVSACDSPMGPNDPEFPGIQTAGSTFSLAEANGLFLGEIPYVYTNRTGAPVYLVNCLGHLGIRLDRWESGKWTAVWSPISPLCLSAPIVIEPGASFETTLTVAAGAPESDYHPRYVRSDLSGTFRIVWSAALSSFQSHLPFGESIGIEHRVSNSFQLVVQ